MFIEHFKGAKIHWFSLLSPEPEPGALSAWSQLSNIRWFGSGANSGNHSQLGLGLTTGMSWLHDGLIAAHHHILICHSGDSKSEELCVSCWEESRLRDARTHNSVAHIIALRGFHSVPFHFMLHYSVEISRGLDAGSYLWFWFILHIAMLQRNHSIPAINTRLDRI